MFLNEVVEYVESDEEDITADMLELFIQGVKPLSHDKSTHTRVIAKLPNSEQSSKGKVYFRS
jgi:hypothetical protein